MGEVVSLAERRWWSSGFDAVFKLGIELVNETANYLDGPGRSESAALSRPSQVSYATVSMRMTALLMQLASWLLVVRSFKESETTKEQLIAELKMKEILAETLKAIDLEHTNVLPEMLCMLVKRTDKLREIIVLADAEFVQKLTSETPQSASG
ncbi:MAG: hypothetical protein JWM46_83 [Candidatus Kaiserbacteria bacterium]|nr:hypothetical protein [Candidatus Kaiserbacteria bacterium]